MNTDLKTKTTDWLLSRLDKISTDVSEGILEMADILYELRKRSIHHPYMRSDSGGVLRWYAEVAEGKLSPLAVLAFGGVGTIIRKLIGLPLEKQNEFARGGKLQTIEHDAKGEINVVEKPILQLSPRQLDIAFDEGRVAPLAKQKKALAERAKEPSKRKHRSKVALNIRADLQTGEIVCGQMRFKPHELAGALKELGFKIERIKPTGGRAKYD